MSKVRLVLDTGQIKMFKYLSNTIISDNVRLVFGFKLFQMQNTVKSLLYCPVCPIKNYIKLKAGGSPPYEVFHTVFAFQDIPMRRTIKKNIKT